jgi:2-polyprenyl-6-methoxyphenol hydroxylase-like FAD-dependent oxidoreductase
MAEESRRRGRAVVAGGGIGGLLAARALADHFDEVVVLDRDDLPEGNEPRRGVPQSHHVNGLLSRGTGQLEELFPGLLQELLAAGGSEFDHGEAAPTTVFAGRVPPTTTGVKAYAYSRPLLEWTLRRRVLALPGVQIRSGTAVQGLEWSADRAAVTGVRVVRAEGPADGERPTVSSTGVRETGDAGCPAEVLAAELVVDATGRFTALPEWLAEAGYPLPKATVVDAGLAYSTQIWEGPADGPAKPYHGIQQMSNAPQLTRGTIVSHVEGNRWVVTLFGAADDHPPADEAGWREFARSLANPDLDDLLSSTTPASRVRHFARTENRRYGYGRMRRWPEGLIAIGDSVCAFNPVFGQGITVAALQASALRDALAARSRTPGRELTGFAREFQRTAGRLTLLPWYMSTSDDLCWDYQRRGARWPLPLRVAYWYKQRLIHLVVHDADVFRTFVRVYHMLTSPLALGSPRTLAKVLRTHLSYRQLG